jgi:hypothetical protein
MHWYWFHTFTMRLSFSSGESSRYTPNSSSQWRFSAASACSTCSGVLKASISAFAPRLSMTPGFSHFSWFGFST